MRRPREESRGLFYTRANWNRGWPPAVLGNVLIRLGNRTTQRSGRSLSATWRPHSRPWRVVPLAFVAVATTTAATGVAMHLFRKASHNHYADDILRKDLGQIHFRELLDSIKMRG